MLTTSLSCQTPYLALMSLLNGALSSDMAKRKFMIPSTAWPVKIQIRAVPLLNFSGTTAQFRRPWWSGEAAYTVLRLSVVAIIRISVLLLCTVVVVSNLSDAQTRGVFYFYPIRKIADGLLHGYRVLIGTSFGVLLCVFLLGVTLGITGFKSNEKATNPTRYTVKSLRILKQPVSVRRCVGSVIRTRTFLMFFRWLRTSKRYIWDSSMSLMYLAQLCVMTLVDTATMHSWYLS